MNREHQSIKLPKLWICLIGAVLVQISVASDSVLHGYFDIAVGSKSGTEVTGRLNPEANRRGDGIQLDQHALFEITGGTGAGLFEVESRWDQFGHMFGVLKVASGKTLTQVADYNLTLDYKPDSKTEESIEVSIHVVKTTQLEAFRRLVLAEFSKESRMWGRVNIDDKEADLLITEIMANKGALPNQDYDDPNDKLIEICNTIGGLSRNLVQKGNYGPKGTPKDRLAMRKALYKAYIFLHSRFPVEGFSENESIEYKHRSHQWRYTDPLTGSAIYALEGWQEDMHSKDPELSSLAIDAYEKLLHILEISWEATESNRPIPDDKTRYSGYWSDANRDHRMRTWIGMTALLGDYNRPITYGSHWYPHTSGKHAGFSLLPGWKPSGSFFDLQFWVQSNLRPAYYYWDTARASGFFPDGSISHHTGHGNDIALYAYGYEWLSDKSIKLGGWFKGTPWEISEPFWSETADYLTYTMGNVIYNNGHDMAFSGRSHNSPNIEIFGKKYLSRVMTSLVENKPKGLSLRKEPEIQELIKGLEKGTHQSSVNLPLWNANAMIHRRGGIDQDSYYMSLKMISRRTRGAEGFSPDNNSYHMGDGFFQVKTSGTEYFDVRYDWDWHVLPGTTSEWKTDALPPAKSTYEYPTGRNTYAGVVSNGRCGAASFVYDRSEDPYSSVVAKKSYFMFDEVAVLVGSGIRRVHPGQGNDIVTTIDQASWTTDITFKIGAANEKIVKLGSDVDLNLDTDELSWVHQGNTGYIIWPNQQKKFSHIILKTGSIINDTDTGRSGDAKVFHLALNHGVDPNPSKSVYSYAVVPNVTAGEMAEISNRLNRQLTIRINNRSHHSVQHSGQTMTQVAFFMPSTVEAGDNLSISVDAAAMVLLREGSNQIEAALSDPDFSVTESVINLTVSRKLKSGSYAYRTMGVKNQQAETVEVNDVDAGTRLSFNLPDPSDSKLYHNRQEVYYGMPAAVTIPRQDTPPPNVLMIAVDDLNDWISPLGGHPQSITPNFDRLANQGTRFMNAHCQAPLCGPSRASLFTGLNPSSTGIYLHVKDEEIKLANEVADSATLLTHYFQQHGYKTMGAGKLLHDGAGADLLEDYAGHKDFGPRPEKKFKYDSEGTSTDWGPYPTSQEEMPDYHVASYAIKKLSESHDKPFFLAVGFNRPHVPWYVPQKWFERIDLDSVITPPYLKDDLDDAPEISRIIHNMEPTPKTEWLIEKGYWKEMVRAYLACVSFVDDQLGRVLDALAHSAYADNTIIVLWSDHGYHLGEKNIVAKMTLYEESTRVPLIFAGPGVPVDAYCDRPVGLIDIYPTLLELADLPANKNVEGHSLVPLLKNPLSEWEHPALTFWGLNNTAVRTERYRYIQYEDGSEELYDRSIDPNEWQNLAGNPETKTLRESLRSFVPENQAELSSLCWFPWNAYWIQKTKEAKERISK